MADGRGIYAAGGVSIAGLIEHLGREAERLNGGPGATLTGAGGEVDPQTASAWPFGSRSTYDQPETALRSIARPHQMPSTIGASPAPQGVRYGQLYAPPSDHLAELRRQQAEFARTTREIDRQNMWLWAPALAPVVAPYLAEGGVAALASRARQVNVPEGPLNLPDGELWWRSVQKAARAARDARDGAIRDRGRTQFARTNGIPASKMEAKVHHSDPLEWSHLKPKADPNRPANLWGLKEEHHLIATREWAAFKKSLQGRTPSQAEFMAAKLRIDRLVAPYIRRAGVSWSRTRKLKPGETP